MRHTNGGSNPPLISRSLYIYKLRTLSFRFATPGTMGICCLSLHELKILKSKMLKNLKIFNRHLKMHSVFGLRIFYF